MNVDFLLLFHQPLRPCQSIFSLRFNFIKFYRSVLKFTGSILSFPSCYLDHPLRFFFMLLHVSVLPFSLVLFSEFLSLAKIFIFSFVLREFVIGCWSIFVPISLKCLLGNSDTESILIGSSRLSLFIQVVVLLVFGVMGNFSWLVPGLVVSYVRTPGDPS